MGTDITPTGRYVVVCDICGIGFDTLSLTQSAAAWLAGLAGWSIDFPSSTTPTRRTPVPDLTAEDLTTGDPRHDRTHDAD